MRQTHILPPTRLPPRLAGLCRLSPVPAGWWPFPTLSLQIFPWMPGPLPRRLLWCSARFFPEDFGLPHAMTGSAFSQLPVQRLQHGAISRGCRHSFMFRPPSLLATQVAPTDTTFLWPPWRLLPSIAEFVTSLPVGYANRPNRAIDGRGLSPH